MSSHPSEEFSDPVDGFKSRRVFHSEVITGGRATRIRETIDDHLTSFSFIGEIKSACYLLSCGSLPCSLLGFLYGRNIAGSVTGYIICLISYNFFVQLGLYRFVNFMIQSDSYLKLFLISWIYYVTLDIFLRVVLDTHVMVRTIAAILSTALLIYQFRYFFGRTNLMKIYIYLVWWFFLIMCYGSMLLFIFNGTYLRLIPWLLLFSEMTCRYVFSIGFKDDVYLDGLLFCSVAHTAMFETIRFANLWQMVLESSISEIVITILQNVIAVTLNHSEVSWKIYEKMGGKVELFHLWIYRLEGSCMNVYAYVIPIFYSIVT